MTTQSTTTITIIVTHQQQNQPPGSVLHTHISDHFASEHFLQYAANRELDEQLLQEISCQLTLLLRNNQQIRNECGLEELVTATCFNAKGIPFTHSKTNDNMIIFSVDVA